MVCQVCSTASTARSDLPGPACRRAYNVSIDAVLHQVFRQPTGSATITPCRVHCFVDDQTQGLVRRNQLKDIAQIVEPRQFDLIAKTQKTHSGIEIRGEKNHGPAGAPKLLAAFFGFSGFPLKEFAVHVSARKNRISQVVSPVDCHRFTAASAAEILFRSNPLRQLRI